MPKAIKMLEPGEERPMTEKIGTERLRSPQLDMSCSAIEEEKASKYASADFKRRIMLQVS